MVVRDNLKNLTSAPSVQMHDVPPDMCLKLPEDTDHDQRSVGSQLCAAYVSSFGIALLSRLV